MTCADRGEKRPLGCRRGFALNTVLILIVMATMVVTTSVFLTVAEERSVASSAERARLASAADAVVAEMQERLLGRAQSVSGALRDEDLAALNRSVPDLTLPAAAPGLRLDTAETGWRVVEVREGERLPHDEVPIAAWTDQPRLSYAGLPPVGGLIAARTVVVAFFATVRGERGGVYRVRRDLAVSQVPPHQHALYVEGDAELCASASPNSMIGGPVRIDGHLIALSCAHLLRYAAGIEARDGIIAAQPVTHVLVGSDGQLTLGTVSRAHAEADPGAVLGAWSGRVRVPSTLGGLIGPGRLSSPDVAGSGECDDVPAAGDLACEGGARYLPSVQVRRTTFGTGTEYSVVCGAAYRAGCEDVLGAITYLPWPFLSPPSPGEAAFDPGAPGNLWRGLLPDARREARCTATVGEHTFRTARCPTNPFGFRIDVSALPALAGGLLSIRRADGAFNGMEQGIEQEIVLLTNASTLAGPLTIHSEIPVYVAGDFNTTTQAAYNGPPPAKIHAPRVVIIPNEALAQLQTSAVWDSVPRAGGAMPSAEPLRAETSVTVHAVIRSRYCRSVSGEYFGGVWESVPAVLGDWSEAGLRVIGAVEARDGTDWAHACSAFGAPLGTVPPSGTATLQPASRTLLFDQRLLHPGFQPPGAWGNGNLASSGPAAIPGRPPQRQLGAVGGTAVVRRIRDDQRGLPPVPPAGAITLPGPLPTDAVH